MNWSSAVTAIGGLLVAAFSLWLNYRSRSSSHRAFFYQKQVEAFVTVLNALYHLHQACQHFTALQSFHLNSETRMQFRVAQSRGDISQFYREFQLQHQQCTLFLPSYMHTEISAYIKVLSAISAPDEIANQYDYELVNSRDPSMDLSKAYSRVVAAARRGLGVEPLSEEILKLIGEYKTVDSEKKMKKVSR